MTRLPSQRSDGSEAPRHRAAAGVDAGSTLVKLALRDRTGTTRTETLPAAAAGAVQERLAALAPARVGLTGGGAARLAGRLAAPARRLDEFEAWAAGARALLVAEGRELGRFLLVSVGTGTSAILVEPGGVRRVGGTALGGGTLLGLGAALTGERDFDALAALAARGDRSRVDLLIEDIYPEGDFVLPGKLNAASFAKLARDGAAGDAADLAHGIAGLVGENVGLICAGLAARHEVEAIAFGGSTLRGNPALTAILAGACLALGRAPHFLADGPYAGALGALALADAA